MKTVKISIPLVLALILYTAFSYATYAESGSDKYTLTKLEWIINYLNSKSNAASLRGCVVWYNPIPPNTINVTVVYGLGECPTKTKAESTLDYAKGIIRGFASEKNWKWVNIQGELKEINQVEQELFKELGKDHPRVKEYQEILQK